MSRVKDRLGRVSGAPDEALAEDPQRIVELVCGARWVLDLHRHRHSWPVLHRSHRRGLDPHASNMQRTPLRAPGQPRSRRTLGLGGVRRFRATVGDAGGRQEPFGLNAAAILDEIFPAACLTGSLNR